MTCDEDRLLAFLSEDLDEPLREPAPEGLADRIRLAASAAPSPRRRPMHRRPLIEVAMLAAAAVVIALVVVVGVNWGRRPAPSTGTAAPSMAATNALVGLGRALPMHVHGHPTGTPFLVGTPQSMTIGTVTLEVAYYRVDDGEAVVAHSMQAFAMPAGGAQAAGGKAWTAQMGGMAIYCLCGAGMPAAAIVTPMSSGAATELAAFLDMPT
jgi:hypothetical protein